MNERNPNALSALTGWLWVLGGLVWLAAGLIADASLEVLWIPADLLLLGALLALVPRGADRASASRWLLTGLGVAIVARVVFIAGEVVAAATGSDENALLPIAAMGTAIGMTMFGAAVLRQRRWSGMARWTPLLMGIYPFVAMFPYVAVTGEPSTIAITLWAVPAVLLGVSVLQPTFEPTRSSVSTGSPI